jgi:hypothetical protein
VLEPAFVSADTRTVAAAHNRRQLGQLMVEEGFLGTEELSRALEEQERTGRPLGKILVELGFVSAGAVANALAEQHGGLLKTEFGISAGLHAVETEEPEPAPAEDPAAEALALIEELEGQIDAAAAEREVLIQRIEELQSALAARPVEQAASEPEPEPEPEPERSHLIFLPSPQGYALYSAEGPAPAPRTVLGSADGVRYTVVRIGPSPLPGRSERCAYLELVSPEPAETAEAEPPPAPPA